MLGRSNHCHALRQQVSAGSSMRGQPVFIWVYDDDDDVLVFSCKDVTHIITLQNG